MATAGFYSAMEEPLLSGLPGRADSGKATTGLLSPNVRLRMVRILSLVVDVLCVGG